MVVREGGWWRRTRAVRRVIAVMLVLGVLGGAAGAWWGARQTVDHQATAVILLNPLQGNPFSPDARGDDLVNLETEAQLVSSDAVLGLLAASVGDGIPAVTASDIEVSVPTNTQLLSVTVSAASPSTARAAAQLLATTYLDYRRTRTSSALFNETANIDEQIAERGRERADLAKRLRALPDGSPGSSLLIQQILGVATQVGELRTLLGEARSASLDPGQVVTPAAVDRSTLPTGPVPMGAVGLLLGLGAGALAALALVRVSGVVRRVADLAVLGVPVHGVLPRSPGGRPGAVLRLRAVLLGAHRSRPMVVLTCTAGADGRAGDAGEVIASSFAAANIRTVLVDLAGHEPGSVADGDADAGLVQVLRGETDLDDVLEQVGSHLSTLKAGARVTVLDSLTAAPEMALLLRELRSRVDVVVLHGTAGSSPRTQALAAEADLVVLEVQADLTTLTSVEEDLADLAAAGSGPVGLLLVEPPVGSRSAGAARGPLRRVGGWPAAVVRSTDAAARHSRENAVSLSRRASRTFVRDAMIREAGTEVERD